MRQNTPPWLTPQPREKTSDAASTLSKAQRLPKQKRSLTLCCKTNTDASEHHTLYSLAATHFWDRLVTGLSCPPTLPLRAAISHAHLFLSRMQTPWRLRWKPCSRGNNAECHLWESHHGFSAALNVFHLLHLVHSLTQSRNRRSQAHSMPGSELTGRWMGRLLPSNTSSQATGRPRTPLANERVKPPFTVPHPSHRIGKSDNLFKAPRARHSFRILSEFTPTTTSHKSKWRWK